VIDADQILIESQFSILYLREKSMPCQTCGKKPNHDYQPGARLIWCGNAKCRRSLTDSRLDHGFADWNNLQNDLARQKKSR
jgi:hypothetical protein